MWPWWARIPPEDFTDVTLVIEDNDDPDDDEPDEPDDLMTPMKVSDGKNLYFLKSYLKAVEVKIIEEEKRSNGLWRFASGAIWN